MDIFEYAIKMETEGEKFYLDQAEANKDNGLRYVFLALARDEANHARIIRDRKDGLKKPLKGEADASVENVFGKPGGFKFENGSPTQTNVYREAMKKEQESIDLYKRLSAEAGEDRELYQFLIKQEEEHYRLLDEIVKFVARADEWVESAEFGIREEY